MENVIKIEECRKVVQKLLKKREVKVVDFEIIKFTGDYLGFCADYCKLKIYYEANDGERKCKLFFVKALPVSNLKKREFIKASGVFKKEADLARHLLPEILKYSGSHKWCPTFYYVLDDLMIMGDLTCHGFQMLNIKTQYSPCHIFKALQTLAVFHAAGIAYDQIELKPNNTNMGEKFKSMLFQTQFVEDNLFIRTGFKAVKAVALQKTKYGIGTKYEEIIREKLISSLNETFEMYKNQKTNVPCSWIHQDLWNNNLMFSFRDCKNAQEPDNCVLVDFGISSYSPITHDVLMLIYLCLSTDNRRAMYGIYLKFYYEVIQGELSNHGLENLFSWQDFVENCEDFTIFPLALRALYLASTFLPSKLLQNLSQNDPEGYRKLILEDRDDAVLDAMDYDSDYGSLMKEAVEELIEYLLMDREV